MLNQLRAVIQMQWRSRVNSLRRESTIGGLVTLVLVLLLATSSIGVFLVGLLGGFYLAREGSDEYYLIAWNGVCLFFFIAWTINFSHDVFRSDAIPLQRLMHLPISPLQAFFMNFFQNWLNLPMLYLLTVSVGMILGGVIQTGPLMLWQLTPVLLYGLLFTSITSLAQARIAVWLVNPRTRRFVLVLLPAVVGVLSLGFALSTSTLRKQLPKPAIATSPSKKAQEPRVAQTPKPTDVKSDNSTTSLPADVSNNQVALTDRQESLDQVETQIRGMFKALQVLDITFPPMWLAGCLFEQTHPNFTSWVILGTMFCASALSLKSNYALTLKYYKNGFDSELISKKKEEVLRPSEEQLNSAETASLIERSYPGLDETYSAIVSMSWISLSRSPEIKLSILLPLMQPIIMVVLFGSRGGPQDPHLQVISIVALTALGLFLSSGFLCNLFGLDRAGFRYWVLSPIPRHTILHARNIAFGFPALFLMLAIGLGMVLFWKTSLLVMLESLFGLLAFFPLYLLITNIMSILAPLPLPPGGMHPKEFSWKTLMMNLLLTCSLPLFLVWCCIPVGLETLLQWFWPKLPSGPVALVGLILVFWRSWVFYHKNLPGIGDMLQAREIELLRTVTLHVEKK